MTTEPAEIAARVVAAVAAVPGVSRLHGGAIGDLATYLPGNRLVGIRIDGDGPVELGVVVRMGHPIPQVVEQVRHAITAVYTNAELMFPGADITIADIDSDVDEEPG